MKLTGPDGLTRSILQAVVFGVPGAFILLGIFDIVLGDTFIALGYIGERSHGWIFLGTGIILYLIEIVVYYGILKRR